MKLSIMAGVLAATFALNSAPALAALVHEDSSTAGGSVSGNFLDVEWESTPTTVVIDFTAHQLFDFFLNDYQMGPGSSTSDVSGYTLDILDGPSGTATSRLTNDTNFCSGADAPVSDFSGNCSLITATGNSGSNADSAAKPGDLLFADLGEGFYRLGFFDSSSPPEGTARFELVAVPAPASLPLFAAALALTGFGVWRRRRHG
ncbi:MAG: PEP-CTERM sorting domain-containing protein [Alphaproteobacteria bacterium]